MADRLALLINHELCFDCKACEVACKQEYSLPVGLGDGSA